MILNDWPLSDGTLLGSFLLGQSIIEKKLTCDERWVHRCSIGQLENKCFVSLYVLEHKTLVFM